MTAIKIENLTKKFGDKAAVNNLSLEVEQGELLALLGVNGAGKTTCVRMLSCLLEPTGGDALLLGESITENPSAIKKIINVSPQETAVARNLTVTENLEMIAGVYGMSKPEIRAKTQQMLKEFNLESEAKNKAKNLSGGTQRRLSIAMALISSPQILFLDEPTLGLDVIARRELWNAVKKLKGKVTVVLTTHYMEEAENLSDRIAIMSCGSLLDVGTAQELIAKSGADNFEDAFVAIATGGSEISS